MAMPPTFKAWVYHSVDEKLESSLKLVDVATPASFLEMKPGKEVVEVLASSLNPADYKIPESTIESRVVAVRKPATPGFDFCGRLVSQPGRLVFGRLAWPDQYGSLGQYVLVNDNDYADLPTGVDILHAAATPIAALTAYQSLAPHVKEGDRVLCNGGSGGVGTFTIQIAKLFGCHVVATCSSKNAKLCKELGADEVIAYTKGDIVTQLADQQQFDAFIDNVGSDPTLHRRATDVIKPDGHFVSVSAMLGSLTGILSMLESLCRPRWLGGPAIKYTIVLCQPNKKQLHQIGEWIAQRKLRVVIDEKFKFEDVPRAISKLRTGRARGKIVIQGAHWG